MWVGWRFHRLIVAMADPSIPDSQLPARPEAVEAWLPISSLVSLIHWIKSGVTDSVHPAGLVIFTLVLSTSLLMRRGFCSWACPIGLMSEYTHKAGKRLLGFNLRMPRWLDVHLRLIKYGVLAFFLRILVLLMSADDLYAFINSPYNLVADAKMYMLFANITWKMIYILVALTLLSVLFKNFWCRYLCPYGALLGLLSFLSPVAIRRDKDACVGCGKCGKACPNLIPVDRKGRVWSVECTACYSCVSACPKEGALAMRPIGSKRRIPLLLYGVILVALFVTVPRVARWQGHWQSDTPTYLYRLYCTNILKIGHPDTSGSVRQRPRNMPPGIRRGPRSDARPPASPARPGQTAGRIAAAPPAD